MAVTDDFRTRADWPPVVAETLAFAHDEALKRFRAVLDDVEPALLELAREKDDDNDKDRIITALELFSRQRGELDSAFTAKWNVVCDRLQSKSVGVADQGSKKAADKMDLSHLSLLGDEELQDKLALQNLSSATAQELSYLLKPLLSVLEELLPDYVVTRSTVAFYPSALAECVYDGIQPFDAGSDVRHAILNLFRHRYFVGIDSLYQRIAHQFEERGYAVAKPQSIQRSAVAKPTSTPSSAAPTSSVATAQQPVSAGDNLAEELGQLLSTTALPSRLSMGNAMTGDVSSGSMAGAGGGQSLSSVPADIGSDMSIVTVSNQEVDGMLATMQAHVVSDQLDGELPDVHKTMAHLLKSKASPNSHRVMSQVGENVINLISLLFEFILHNDNISTSVANLLMRLQLPFMRLAVKDQSLFSNRDHCARQLLNLLAELAVTVNSVDDSEYLKIHTVVEELTERFEGSIEQVEKQLLLLRQYMDERNTEIEKQQALVEQHVASDEQKASAERIAKKLVNEKIEAIENSLIFHSLLAKVWVEVLKNRYLQHGFGTEAWQHADDLLAEIIVSTQVGSGPDEKRRLLSMLPKLVPSIEAVFKEAEIDDLIRSHFLDQLHEIHLRIIKGKAGGDLIDQELEHSSSVRSLVDDLEEGQRELEQKVEQQKQQQAVGHDYKANSDEPPVEKAEQQRIDTKEVLKIIDGLRPGTWMEYYIKGEPVRCKIALYAPNQQKYIFVEGSGRKLFERIRPELLVDIQDRLARVVEGGDLFEVAMSSVVANIRQQRQAV